MSPRISRTYVSARAPSNIALVKYMGKKDSKNNIPENSSLSLTLNTLCTIAEIEIVEGEGVEAGYSWVSEAPTLILSSVYGPVLPKPRWLIPELKEAEVQRVCHHLGRVRRDVLPLFSKWDIKERLSHSTQFRLRSANTFPAASGIASSASSFAAMTLVMASALAKDFKEFENIWCENSAFRCELAKISRVGSGSSCRSFEGPWVEWVGEEVKKIETSEMPELAHFILLVKEEQKEVSSSSAHTLVRTSPLWQGRPMRAENRCSDLLRALESGNMLEIAKISWMEAWEMHSLFHTSAQPFTYWEAKTLEILKWFAPFITGAPLSTAVAVPLELGLPIGPPIVTLDAGPNVHVLVAQAYRNEWRLKLESQFKGVEILEDRPGMGASLLGIRNY